MNTTVLLLLGILLASPAAAEFCDGNYVVEAGNWSGVEITEGGTVHRERYNWLNSKTTKGNRYRMNDPTRFGMPADTVLHTAPNGEVYWIAVYDARYTYTVVCNENTFTNDTSSMSYKAVWLARPCRRYSCMNRHVDEVTVTHADGEVTFKIVGHVTDSDRDKHYTTRSKTIPAGIEGVHSWILPINESTATITDATLGCCMLEIEAPANVLGYRIDAVSDNHTAHYERNFGMMQRNTTENGKEFFEVVGVTTENGVGMSSFGPSKYILPSGDYTISMIVYTPFEKLPVNITMCTDEEVPETQNRIEAIRALISMFTITAGIYILIRGA